MAQHNTSRKVEGVEVEVRACKMYFDWRIICESSTHPVGSILYSGIGV